MLASSYAGYNEVVLSARAWAAALPSTIVAFFYLATPDCEQAAACRARAELAHARFRAQYPQSNAPMLRLDQLDWNEPFRALVLVDRSST